MSTEYARLIAELDKTLTMLRRMWLEAPRKDKAACMGRIDEALDERLRLMGFRDAA